MVHTNVCYEDHEDTCYNKIGLNAQNISIFKVCGCYSVCFSTNSIYTKQNMYGISKSLSKH